MKLYLDILNSVKSFSTEIKKFVEMIRAFDSRDVQASLHCCFRLVCLYEKKEEGSEIDSKLLCCFRFFVSSMHRPILSPQ